MDTAGQECTGCLCKADHQYSAHSLYAGGWDTEIGRDKMWLLPLECTVLGEDTNAGLAVGKCDGRIPVKRIGLGLEVWRSIPVGSRSRAGSWLLVPPGPGSRR